MYIPKRLTNLESGKVIQKSKGVTKTEELLSELCDRTFLKLWSYPNPYKDDGKELCDLLAVFEDHVFIFFDRESRKFDNTTKEIDVTWKRWKKEAIDKQVKTSAGAERYIRNRREIFLNEKKDHPFPLAVKEDAKIYKIIVAHGAMEACKSFSSDNVYGSLAVSYGENCDGFEMPFLVNLDRSNPVHLLDSHNLEILFEELDTFSDLVAYFEEKERAINRYEHIAYCGEEDLLAHYFLNFSERRGRYEIGTTKKDINSVYIGEGEWESFSVSDTYLRRKNANEGSYIWDELIQKTCGHIFDGTVMGNAEHLNGKSAIHEMAKEPRLMRRVISGRISEAVRKFPVSNQPNVRFLSYVPSHYPDKAYIFLQLKCSNILDYENEYRPKRRALLEVACGVARNKFPHLKKVIGIAIDAPRYAQFNSEDFLLLECENWSKDEEEKYQELNKELKLFETENLKRGEGSISDFPLKGDTGRPKRKIGRNEPCFCGSGLKYKKCHYLLE